MIGNALRLLRRRPALAAVGGVLYLGGAVTTYILFAKSTASPVNEQERRAAFDANASTYDTLVDSSEQVSGIFDLRRSLIGRAAGNVLEIGAGTGRNTALYVPSHVLSLTLADFSLKMLEQAEAKQRSTQLKESSAAIPTRYVVVDAAHLPFDSGSFDCVVDTFGLCSYEDPVAVLREMCRVCKPNGKLLLLEHGRSTFSWLNGFLDSQACAHAQKFGCYWNRDIEALMSQAGLQQPALSRRHLGTTTMVEASPLPQLQETLR